MPAPTHLTLPGRTKPYVMAHRGNRALLPENTLAAFQRALDDGADILETDLHLTADGVFACIHDGTVDRTTDGSGPVAQMTLAELKRLNAAHYRPGAQPQSVPTLTELAAILPPYAALALELKTDRFLEPEVCRKLAAELESSGVRQRAVVLSFSLARVLAVKAAAPDIPVGLISMSRVWPLSGIDMIGPIWPLAFANPLFAWLAHRRGQLFCPLDPIPEKRLWYYRLIGSDAILTDNPAETIRRLGR
ncbi:MAG TPA: glycerophosphodiester phosphodiesterase family protein [Anaerolineaceae bacterium]